MAQPQPVQKNKVDWSKAVRDYVQRAFAQENNVAGVSREEVQEKLKQVITAVAEKGMMDDVDWASHPLPQQFVLQDRRRALGVDGQQNAWPTPASHLADPLHGHTNNASLSPSKKRKSTDASLTDHPDDSQPPWRKTNSRNMFEDRITYANQGQANRVDKKQRKNKEKDNFINSKFSPAELEKRRQRFGNISTDVTPPWASPRTDDAEARSGPVVGTCQQLEKRYFRLTAPPKPETVRPLPVLEQTLALLKKKWREEKNYGYICDQFKSLRQDLTVQHIRSAFTVDVYEIHARIALEKGDLGEYNQCQTQLRALYSQNLGGHPEEFLAYRILYFIHTCNRTDMNDMLADLTPTDKNDHAVKHALAVRSALALGNYHRFFRLYIDYPNLGGNLMDKFVDRERVAALANMCKAYKPFVKLSFLSFELGFESDRACLDFLVQKQAQHLIQDTDGELCFQTGKAGLLFDQLRAQAFAKVDIKGQI
ncbi:SAC3/GANP domain protein [Lophium mytilinum]|uniref:SAC3/GANP domain protein n=1 Tax=Lophium mytilinum TaxID=390894 RepID=A0A6A6QBU0_9PEZI|nr:SAC3/GANP domain protein [Lophium mytilinum]